MGIREIRTKWSSVQKNPSVPAFSWLPNPFYPHRHQFLLFRVIVCTAFFIYISGQNDPE